MKTLIKSLLILAISSICSFAGTYVTNNMGVATATPSTTPVVLQSLTLYSTNTVPTIVYFYDGWYTTTNNGYTNYVTYVTNQTVLYTNTMGITNTYTNTVIATAANAVAANTGAVSLPILTVVVPANNVLLTLTKDIVFGQRMTFSNTLVGLSGMIQYRTQ